MLWSEIQKAFPKQWVIIEAIEAHTVPVNQRHIDRMAVIVLVDAGSASCIFSVDHVESIGLVPMPEDVLHVISGVGGTEVVFQRNIDSLKIGAFCLPNFQIEVGGMDYGFEIDAILGMDFLLSSKAVINLK